MDYNIPDIYADSYQTKNTKDKIEIIDVLNTQLSKFKFLDYEFCEKTFEFCKKTFEFDEKTFELFEKNKKKYILISKTNFKNFTIYNDGDFDMFNNRIFFPKRNVTVTFSIFKNNCNNLIDDEYLDDSYYKQTTLILYKYNIDDYKYNIISKDAGIMENLETLFKIKDNRYSEFTFLINIRYWRSRLNSSRNFSDIPKLIKLCSGNFIFIYEPTLNEDKSLVLYLIAIKNTLSDEYISIDIKFNNIETIYNKYEIAIDKIKNFIFTKSNFRYMFDKYDISKHIKGLIYPNSIFII